MKIAVILIGLMLVLSTAVLPDASYAQQKRKVSGQLETDLEFQMSGCTNSMTCNADFFVGDLVEFKGMLTSIIGDPITGAEITVYQFTPKPEMIPIASGVTGLDGDIELSWTTQFTPRERAPNDVTRKYQTEIVTIFAVFEGDDQYAPSRSSKNTASIKANELHTFINSDKNLYRQGDSALIFLAFVDSHDEFVDPDSLRVILNDNEVEVEKKKTGSYTFTISALPKEHTQLIVIPNKEGYNLNNGFLTIIVDGLK